MATAKSNCLVLHRKNSKSFKENLIPSEHDLEFRELTIKEFETAFKSLKRNKSVEDDEITINILLSVCDKTKFPMSYKRLLFWKRLDVAKMTPVFKNGDSTNQGNCRPMSILPVFSKILQRTTVYIIEFSTIAL